jgi:hypothetical protein
LILCERGSFDLSEKGFERHEIMKILSREPQSATSNEVAQLLPAFANKDIHSFISTTSLQDLDGLVSFLAGNHHFCFV